MNARRLPHDAASPRAMLWFKFVQVNAPPRETNCRAQFRAGSTGKPLLVQFRGVLRANDRRLT